MLRRNTNHDFSELPTVDLTDPRAVSADILYYASLRDAGVSIRSVEGASNSFHRTHSPWTYEECKVTPINISPSDNYI